MIQTEHEFHLPKGLMDEHGNLHREGVMRLATAADEILPLKDPRVQKNQAYLIVILLSRVVIRLGGVEAITPKTIESLFVEDLAYLQNLYNEVNVLNQKPQELLCPHCQHVFSTEDRFQLGESLATPSIN